MAKGTKMNSREAFLLRTRLRQVNMEYSVLVRDRSGERRFVRMAELRAERHALMALLFGRADTDFGGGVGPCGSDTVAPPLADCPIATLSDSVRPAGSDTYRPGEATEIGVA